MRVKPLTKAQFADWQQELQEEERREAALVGALLERRRYALKTNALFMMSRAEIEVLDKKGFHAFLEELKHDYNIPPELDYTGNCYIYFIQAGDRGPIKIGRANNVKHRLDALQTAHHETLGVLGVIKGSPANERLLHCHFDRWRIRGEWFRPAAGLISFIANYADSYQNGQ